MAQYTTLLPSAGQRRTGKLYDKPDGEGQSVIKSNKVITTDDGRKLIQDKAWTEEGGWCIEVKTPMHALVSRALDKHEQAAWERVLTELHLQGYKL